MKVAVIGAGQMGADIAQVAAQSGCEVLLCDAKPELAEKGRAGIDKQLQKQIEKGKLDEPGRQATMARLNAVSAVSDLADCDFAIEAIVENEAIKCELFARLDKTLKASAVLASNTSSISITKLAAATQRPSQVIGMHFMNPVPVMKLVELIRALQTSDVTYDATRALAAKMGKTTVLANEAPGFIVNRILIPMLNEAAFALESGLASAADIDTAMKLGTNQPMGPLTLADFIGLDTVLAICEVLHSELGEDKYRPAPLLRRYVAAGWLGKKTGRGFFAY